MSPSHSSQDAAALSQLNSIEQERRSHPLISEKLSLSSLLSEYKDNSESFFLPGIQDLMGKKRFLEMRRVRGDGNCFYRSVVYSYIEELLVRLKSEGDTVREEARKEHKRFLDVIERSKKNLIQAGYDEFVFEMFQDELLELLHKLEEPDSVTLSSLLQLFTSEENGSAPVADCYTWYMRLVTAGYLLEHHERFYPFIMTDDASSASSMADAKVNTLLNGNSEDAAMRGYCQREVEPMGKESEQLHVTALTEALGLRVDIHYLDGRPFDVEKGLSCIHFRPEEDLQDGACPFVIHLLYRPGHYDILYNEAEAHACHSP